MNEDAALPRIPEAFRPFAQMHRWCAWLREKRVTKAGLVRGQKTRLPGDKVGSTRSMKKIASTRHHLAEQGLLRQIQGWKRGNAGQPGVVAVHEVVSLLPPGPKKQIDNDKLTVPADVWGTMLFTLSPVELRLLLWLLATREGETFCLPTADAAAMSRSRPERAAEALRRLSEGGRWLVCTTPPEAVRRLPGWYRLAERLREGGQHPTTTPNPTLVVSIPAGGR